MIFFCKILFKNMNSAYEFALKEGPKVKIEKFWRTKSWKKILEGLKQKVIYLWGQKTYLAIFSFMSF